MNLSRLPLKHLFVFLIALSIIIITNLSANAQDRPRIVNNLQPRPQSYIKKTSSSRPTNSVKNNLINRSYYNATARSMMLRAIQTKIGSRYRIGTEGPYTYDCSGFVWKVFQEIGIDFTRTSARSLWQTFEPVYGNDRFQFGTLVFFNRLGHIGIVADENGFYHASSSKGVTYSPFEGYWEKRIVGFRRIPINHNNSNDNVLDIIPEDIKK